MSHISCLCGTRVEAHAHCLISPIRFFIVIVEPFITRHTRRVEKGLRLAFVAGK